MNRIASTMKKLPSVALPRGFAGLAVYTACLCLAAFMLPDIKVDKVSTNFLLGIGFLAAWRYSWGALHYIRSLFYRKFLFPRWRGKVDANIDNLLPSKIYILITVFRIETETAARSIRSAVEEAIRCGVPVTIVASIVEMGDEFLFRTIMGNYDVPGHVQLKIVRVPGTGKRTGLANGFKAISRDMPPADAVVVVMDGDTILLPDLLRRSTPFFKLRPDLGALTTDEVAEVHGTALMQEWHDLRFAQRQILMSSIALSKRVMTLTGRMSIFRADIVTDNGFIQHVTSDKLDHWRLGTFNFLTGDDKSSLYWVIQKGYEQIYLPDVQVMTLEDPPSSHFVKASTQLMFRWFGNMLRTNERILRLGPSRMPFFVWWSFLDQRISMWTALAGPTFACMLAFKYGAVFFLYYFVWIGMIRGVMTYMLLSARPETSWRYPFLLYYSQVYGALIKTWVMFRLDIQSWTRQKTKLNRGLSWRANLWNRWSSHTVHGVALVLFVCAVGFASSMIAIPHSSIRTLIGYNHYAVVP